MTIGSHQCTSAPLLFYAATSLGLVLKPGSNLPIAKRSAGPLSRSVSAPAARKNPIQSLPNPRNHKLFSFQTHRTRDVQLGKLAKASERGFPKEPESAVILRESP
jgi:hypothetical protein